MLLLMILVTRVEGHARCVVRCAVFEGGEVEGGDDWRGGARRQVDGASVLRP